MKILQKFRKLFHIYKDQVAIRVYNSPKGKHLELKAGDLVLVQYEFDTDDYPLMWQIQVYSHWDNIRKRHIVEGRNYEDGYILPYKGNEDKLGKKV